MTGSKNIVNGRVVNPGGYIIEKFEIVNYAGEASDITNLLVSITINESLYSPNLILRFEVVDDSNFFRDWEIRGKEKINLIISSEDVYDLEQKKIIEHEFVVTSIPLFTRPRIHTTTFACTAVSTHSYVSSLKMISRGISQGSTEGEIFNILINDCGVPEERIMKIGEGSSSNAFPLAIPYMTPLAAVEFLRRRSTNAESDNFYVAERLGGSIICATESDLLDQNVNPVYAKYVASANIIPGDALEEKNTYLREMRRILSWSTKKIFPVFEEAITGAFASKKKTIDIENKEKRTVLFMTESDPNDSFKFPFLGGEVSTEKTLNESVDAHVEFHHFPESSKYARLTENHLLPLKASAALLNNIVLSIELKGDLNMRVGHRVNITLPSAWRGKTNEIDDSLSGDYIVVGAVHRFEEGMHLMSCSVKKI
jgi:hypothetical protein